MLTGDHKVFLFLQGPHGPFFQRLARMVRHSGADVWRVGFNAGDRLFWQDRDRYVAYRGDAQGWPDFFKTLIVESASPISSSTGMSAPFMPKPSPMPKSWTSRSTFLKKAICAPIG